MAAPAAWGPVRRLRKQARPATADLYDPAVPPVYGGQLVETTSIERRNTRLVLISSTGTPTTQLLDRRSLPLPSSLIPWRPAGGRAVLQGRKIRSVRQMKGVNTSFNADPSERTAPGYPAWSTALRSEPMLSARRGETPDAMMGPA